MPREAWQSPFSSRCVISKNVFYSPYHGFLTLRNLDFDDIEPPWHVSRPQPSQPLVGTALNEFLLFPVHGRKAADLCVLLARLDLGKK